MFQYNKNDISIFYIISTINYDFKNFDDSVLDSKDERLKIYYLYNR